MAIDAPVILWALFFTIIAIIVASAFLARKSAANKPKPNQEETRSEEATELYQRRAEVDALAPFEEENIKENKAVDAEDEKEDPVSIPAAIEEIGMTDETEVAEAELSPAKEAQIQAAAVPEVASGQETICDSTPVDVFNSGKEPIRDFTPEDLFNSGQEAIRDSAPVDVFNSEPVLEPVPKRMPVVTVPELLLESTPELASIPPVTEPDHEPVQEPVTEVDSESACGLFSEPAPEPVSEPSSEPVSESSSETISEAIPEQVLEAIAEQVSKAIAEQISEDIFKQVPGPSVEQISEAPPELPQVVPVVTEHSEVAAAPVEAEEEAPSFKYGKKGVTKTEKRMTKDELEEEQRIEFTSDFTSL